MSNASRRPDGNDSFQADRASEAPATATFNPKGIGANALLAAAAAAVPALIVGTTCLMSLLGRSRRRTP